MAMAAWRLSPMEAMALTDEQFNALMCRLVERRAREDAGRGGGEREVSDETALHELGVTVEKVQVSNGD